MSFIEQQLILSQTHTFTTWCNFQLGKEIDLEQDFKSGANLISLLEKITDFQAKNFHPEPKSEKEMKENLQIVFKFMEDKGIELTTYGIQEIFEGKLEPILDLLWDLVQRFLIDKISFEEMKSQKALLSWCQKQVNDYETVDIEEFASSWADGMGFCSLIHKFKPELIENYNFLNVNNKIENLNLAFNIAKEKLNIPKLLKAEELIESNNLNEKCVLLYLVELYRVFSKGGTTTDINKKEGEKNDVVVGYVPGVFDLFHTGHKTFLNKAHSLCDRLIVGVHTDQFVTAYKRKPHHDQNTRKQNISKNMNYREEDIIFVGNVHLDVVKKYKVNKFIHGNDWEINSYKKQIRYYEDGLDKMGVTVEIVPYTKGISTSKLISKEIPNVIQYKRYFFDLDNTLLINKKPMPFAPELVDRLNKLNKELYVMSNNNRHTPIDVYNMLKNAGINIPKENVITSLKHVYNFLDTNYKNKNVFVWGTEKSIAWLKDRNINVISIKQLTEKSKIDIVVVLYRNDYHYNELVSLCNLCKQHPYICGNKDLTYPDKFDVLPDTGIVIHLINKCTNKKPIFVCGKPNPDMIPLHLKPNSIMIGDNPLTDKIFAINLNIPFIFVSNKWKEAEMTHLGVMIDYLKLNEEMNLNIL
ncbi:spectrin beta chain [Anaeramoeba flamelloides]|uniref:Spectrin beta chain n=1 Tax=Anaeramoeba flamelloides TaxID=1746091 RepID=A0ABQ8YFS5_9EUKA|nr:spectrin beta chain [Anaeramoeba flamelloides]